MDFAAVLSLLAACVDELLQLCRWGAPVNLQMSSSTSRARCWGSGCDAGFRVKSRRVSQPTVLRTGLSAEASPASCLLKSGCATGGKPLRADSNCGYVLYLFIFIIAFLIFSPALPFPASSRTRQPPRSGRRYCTCSGPYPRCQPRYPAAHPKRTVEPCFKNPALNYQP